MANGNMEKKTILVVDDDREIVKMEKILFSRAGYSVMTALNGWDCMRVLATGEKPALVILDIMMPEQSGYDVYKKIRENRENDVMHVLFYTALPEQELNKVITLLETDGYAQKGMNNSALVEKVREMTGKPKTISHKP